MAQVQILTLASIPQLLNLNGLYLIGYAWLFGMCELKLPTQLHAQLIMFCHSHMDLILWW